MPRQGQVFTINLSVPTEVKQTIVQQDENGVYSFGVDPAAFQYRTYHVMTSSYDKALAIAQPQHNRYLSKKQSENQHGS